MENGLFEVSQNIVLLNSEGKILILQKGGKYLLPGGRIQANEAWDKALQREIEEETGISDFRIERVVEVASSDTNDKIILTFLGSTNVSKVVLSDEHESYAWISEHEIDNYDFWHPSIKERILKAL
jgi:8-oxo-dGTP pyrophosphatase MutT (NUDIX family)